MSGILVLFGAATLSAPAAVWPEIQLTLTRVLSLQALTQVLAYLGSSGHALRYVNVLWITHLLAQQPALMQALREHVWPVVASTTKKLLFAEAWVFVWKQVEDVWRVLWGETKSSSTSANSTAQEKSNDDDTHVARQSWAQQMYGQILQTFHKGGPKFVKALLKKHVEDFIFQILSKGVTYAKEATFG
eukprot:scaffold905_cov160-Amphora_coffeaeformis.AAC.1